MTDILSVLVTLQPGEAWTDGACKTCLCMLMSDGSVSVSCQQQRCPDCKIVSLQPCFLFHFN